MKQLIRSPYAGLIVTGLIASAALMVEARLSVSEGVHFLLQLIWIGVASAALLAFAVRPLVETGSTPAAADQANTLIPELYDPDRQWMQSHPDEPQPGTSQENWEQR